MPTTFIPPHLIESLQKRRCVIFVGSGLSTFAGFPSWQELIDRLVEEAQQVPTARTDGLDKLIEANDPLALVNFARSTLDKFYFFELLEEIFGREIQLNQIPQVHRVITSTDYRAFITTSYDQLIESAFFIERQSPARVLTSDSIDALATALYRPAPFILKLHGDINASQSIVLTEDDYDSMIFQKPHLRLFMHALGLSYTLLFVGYSLRDPDYRLILKELNLTFEGYAPPRFAFVADATEVEIDQLKKTLNIEPIPYSSTNHHQEVVQLLEELQQIAPYR
jgi:hypothetical protein